MKKIRCLCFFAVFCLLLSLAAPAALALAAPQTTAKSVIVLDCATSEVLYEKNADERRSPASLTKIMTGLLAVEAVESGQVAMDEIVTAGADCQTGLDSSSSNASIVSGEQMSFRDYLYCAMVVSANEACNVLASRVSGSIGAFVEQMNARAAELGCQNTHFADPNGLSNDNHYTTARELSVILLEALRHEDFNDAFCARSYTVAETNANKERQLKSSNALMTDDSIYAQYGSYIYAPALGGKTGFTRQAGYCLASLAEKNGLRLLTIVMGCPGPLTEDSAEPENFRDSIRLYDWIFDNYAYQLVLSAAEVAGKASVTNAEGNGLVSLRCQQDVTVLLPNDVDPASRELDITLYEDRLQAPIASGTALGEAVIRIDGRSFGPVTLVNAAEVRLSRSEFARERLERFFAQKAVRTVLVVLLVLMIAYLALVLRYRALRKRHLREKRRAEARRRAAQERRRQAAAQEPTLRFSVVDPSERGLEEIDLSRYFDEEKAPERGETPAEDGASRDTDEPES